MLALETELAAFGDSVCLGGTESDGSRSRGERDCESEIIGCESERSVAVDSACPQIN